MKTHNSTNIKELLKNHPHNSVVTATAMLRLGLTREQIRSFASSGWLHRIGNGAYSILDEKVSLDGALYALQAELGLSVHQGGYSALNEKYGKMHNVPYERKIELFAYRGEKMPIWFLKQFGTQFKITNTAFLSADIGMTESDSGGFTIQIPTVERAMLEMLYSTPRIHTVNEAFQVMEFLTSIKPLLVQQLLENCTLVKVKRLFLYMAELAGHAWFKRLDLSLIDLGAGVREIVRGGTFDRKYNIIINDVRSI